MATTIEDSIDQIKSIITSTYPNFGNLFNEGLSRSEISEFESEYNIKLPDDVVTYLQQINGEIPYEQQYKLEVGLFLGLQTLNLEDIKREMDVWKQVVEDDPELLDEEYESLPEGAVNPIYCDADSWIGLATDGSGNSIGVDLKPGPNGKVGQVIVWGRDYNEERIVIFDSWGDFLKEVVKDLKRTDLYRIENNCFEFLNERDANYLNYLFEKRLAEYRASE